MRGWWNNELGGRIRQSWSSKDLTECGAYMSRRAYAIEIGLTRLSGLHEYRAYLTIGLTVIRSDYCFGHVHAAGGEWPRYHVPGRLDMTYPGYGRYVRRNLMERLWVGSRSGQKPGSFDSWKLWKDLPSRFHETVVYETHPRCSRAWHCPGPITMKPRRLPRQRTPSSHPIAKIRPKERARMKKQTRRMRNQGKQEPFLQGQCRLLSGVGRSGHFGVSLVYVCTPPRVWH